jgi:hypothetical protein
LTIAPLISARYACSSTGTECERESRKLFGHGIAAAGERGLDQFLVCAQRSQPVLLRPGCLVSGW